MENKLLWRGGKEEEWERWAVTDNQIALPASISLTLNCMEYHLNCS